MGENLMDASILMTFNKLKNIVKDAGISPEDGVALVRFRPLSCLLLCPRVERVQSRRSFKQQEPLCHLASKTSWQA